MSVRCGLDLIKGASFGAGAGQTQLAPQVPVAESALKVPVSVPVPVRHNSSSVPSLSLPAQQFLLQLFYLIAFKQKKVPFKENIASISSCFDQQN